MSKQVTEPKHTRPAHEVRIGLVKAAIWANPTEDGVRHNVTFERCYRQNEEWKSTTSFGRDHLLKLAKVAEEAHSWITKQGVSKRANDVLTRGALPKTR